MKWQIMVISGSGKYLGWTYPKRANGLIKKGRAVWFPGSDHKVLVLKQDIKILQPEINGGEDNEG